MSRCALALCASSSISLILLIASPVRADTPGIEAPTGPVQVLRITPDGDTPSSQRQIVVQFDRPMVVLGSAPPKLDKVPVTVAPALDCNWHWVNTSTLACELGERNGAATHRGGFQVEQGGFAPATTYKVVVQAGIKAVDGTALKDDATDSFHTEHPGTQYSRVAEWSGPAEPVVRVFFNLPVTQRSAEAHLYFQSSAGRTPVSVIADPDDRRDYYVLPAAGGAPVHEDPVTHTSGGGEDEGEGEGDEEGEGEEAPITAQDVPAASTQAAVVAAVLEGEQARYQWLVGVRSGARPLPADAAVELLEEPGLLTPLGPEAGTGDDRITGIRTFGDFVFQGAACGDRDYTDYHLDAAGAASGPALSCDPQRYVAVGFSSPVSREQLAAHVQGQVNGKSISAIGDLESSYEWMDAGAGDSHSFHMFFSTPLKSDADYVVTVTPGMQDIWGRSLKVGGSARFHTEHRKPDFDMQENIAVLEKNVDSEVPLFVTNLDSLSASYTRLLMPETGGSVAAALGGAGPVREPTSEHRSLDYKLPAVQDLAVEMPLDARGMLGGGSGVVQGVLTPNPPMDDNYRNFKFFAEVTPFDVDVKVGHYNTLVWVTDFATGLPAAGARVDIYTGSPDTIGELPKVTASAVTDASGIAMLPGGAELDPQMVLRANNYGDRQTDQLMVRVVRGADMAVLPLDYQFEVSTYSASHYQVDERLRKKYGHVHAWGTTAEGIYRAGDTIQYKILVRDQDNGRFVPPPQAQYSVSLEDPMGNVVFHKDGVTLSEFGGFSGEYAVPATAPVGWYTFYISSPLLGGDDSKLDAMEVLVSDFTPAAFHVDASLNGSSFQPGDKVEVTTNARLHSGGPYTDAEGRITVSLKAEDFVTDDAAAQGFTFSTYDAQVNQRDQTVNETTGAVDDKGALKADFELQDAGVYYGKLLVEGDVRDERGKYISAVTRADYLGRDRFVGLRLHGWVLQAQQPASVDYVVVDASGKPVAGSDVTVTVERLNLKASRVKGPGNAYLTQYAREWVKAGDCQATSVAQPAACQFTPDAAGSYRITAKVTDTRGRVHSSSLPTWSVGKGVVLWENNDDGALTLVPEKTEYRVGDTARYLVQNPYPGAKALVSIERYGVLKSWVQTLDGSTPVISFPVEQDYVPGFYLSVTVVSPRVAKPIAPGQVDLGKPSFRSAYLPVPVADDYKAIDLKVTTPKDSYKPRDTVTVSVSAKARHGQAGKMELAVAVLDDSVFDLISAGKAYFDPYKGFYTLDGLDLKNYNLLTRLVGRQAFEKKGATPGGDGGAALSLRSLFKFVSYWNPELRTDAKGEAKFSFTVPDNLTGWRVLVVAVNAGDRMGLGQGTFKVNRPTELRPIMPNQVVQGDAFSAGFSVMNRTDKARDLRVHVSAQGAVQGTPVLDQTVHVDPYKRAQLWLPVVTAGPGTVDFTATAGDAADSDGLKQSVPVQRMSTLVHLSQYGTTTGPVTEPVQYPAAAVAGSVQLGVGLSPSVIGNVKGAFSYMSAYPYDCWEQRLTKAVMAANFKRLRAYLPAGTDWPGSDTLPQLTLADAAAYQAPDGGMVYWIADDRYVDPYLSAYTALAFDWLRAQGYAVPEAVEKNLHGYLQGFLKGEGVPDWYSAGMRSSVRAVALAALAHDRDATLDDLRRFEPALKDMDLFGKSWFMQAALELKAPDLAKESLKLILNQSNETGGKFQFSESLDSGYNRILSTPMRSECTILSAVSRYAHDVPADAAMVGDVPFKMVRAITQTRGGKEHWENTQENLFCMQALADYAQTYESTAPDMQVAVSVGGTKFGSAAFHSLQDPAVTVTGPLQDAGKPQPVAIEPQGAGRLYYVVGLDYAPSSLPDAIDDGIGIRREYSVQREGKWQLLKSPMAITRGELVRVDLYVSVPTAREFVVVDDPVPGGLEPVDRNLATSSARDVKAGEFQAAGGAFWFNFDDWSDYGAQMWDFYHQELRHDSARFYSDYLPAGHYHLSYSAQAISSGSFAVQPPKAEEMYDPDVFGLDSSAVLQVTDPAPAP